jgi:hypothetical protein
MSQSPQARPTMDVSTRTHPVEFDGLRASDGSEEVETTQPKTQSFAKPFHRIRLNVGSSKRAIFYVLGKEYYSLLQSLVQRIVLNVYGTHHSIDH